MIRLKFHQIFIKRYVGFFEIVKLPKEKIPVNENLFAGSIKGKTTFVAKATKKIYDSSVDSSA